MKVTIGIRRLITARLLSVGLVVSGLACFWADSEGSKRTVASFGSGLRARQPQAVSAGVPLEITGDRNCSLVPAGSAGEFEMFWQRYSAGPRVPGCERGMCALLEEIAVDDPSEAMVLALGESDLSLREDLCYAVLRGWAAFSPDDAATWAMARTEGNKRLDLEAVFAGAVCQPETACLLAARLSAEYPALSADFERMLITALANDGAYETAVRFAMAETFGTPLLAVAFDRWAASQPEQAWIALTEISDPETRARAFDGLISGWARSDPAATAAYALQLPPSADRARALGLALPQWADRDLVGAWNWASHHGLGSDLDAGLAAVARLPALVNMYPEIAVGWAEGIADPRFRANTLQMLAQLWARQNPEELRRYIAYTPNLRADDYKALIGGL